MYNTTYGPWLKDIIHNMRRNLCAKKNTITTTNKQKHLRNPFLQYIQIKYRIKNSLLFC